MTTTSEQLSEIIAVYNEAWNAHDVERIGRCTRPTWCLRTTPRTNEPKAMMRSTTSLASSSRGPTSPLRPGVVQEWTARATHEKPLSRGDIVAEPSGARIEWKGIDVIPFEDGRIKRKDVYSDSVAILRQAGLL